MAFSCLRRFSILAAVLLSLFHLSSAANPRMLFLVKQQPLVLKYHKGPLLMDNITVNLLWYGRFSPRQRSLIVNFFQSLNAGAKPPPLSAASWWSTTASYAGGQRNVVLGKQLLDENYTLGKDLNNQQLVSLASKLGVLRNAVNFVLTSSDVHFDGFCISRCGSHGSGGAGKARFVYAWVGNSVSQCPGQCAWPFHQTFFGPQTPPLVAPSGDIGVDGMIINLATVLAGSVTNPSDRGYFQGPADAPLEAVSACTGIFGKGAFPGYPGATLVDKTTGASYNAVGVGGLKFLLPAIWDPKTLTCKTPV